MLASSLTLVTNLVDAYNVCSPYKPLEGEDLNNYYLSLGEVRKSEAAIQIEQILKQQQSGEFSTIIMTGHRGVGKTTELRRIAENNKSEYLTAFVNVEEEADISNLEYIDIYLIVLRQIVYKLLQLDIRLDKKILASFENTKTKEDINSLLSDGLKKINSVSDKKGFLIILDNLERCPQHVAKKLFFDSAIQLQDLHCSIIYTVPIASLYYQNGLHSSFGDPYIVPLADIYHLDYQKFPLEHNQTALLSIANIIKVRVDTNSIFSSENELLELVKSSGGNIRQLMQLMQRACITASSRNHDQIQAEDVEYGIKQLQFSLERCTSRKYFLELAKIALSKDVQDDKISQELLFSMALLEYGDTSRWNYPNPVLLRSNIFDKAMRTLTPTSQSIRPWWEESVGVFADDQMFEEAMELGRQYRKSS